MKPLDARQRLQEVSAILAAGQPLPPLHRAWLVLALRKRLEAPSSSLDHLLGLKSRDGGRLHAFSTLPERDQAIRDLARHLKGSTKERAQALMTRLQAHRITPDPAISALEQQHGPLPGSLSQLQRILACRTAASHLT